MDSIKSIVGECRTYSDAACTHSHFFAQLILPLQGSLFIETSLHRCKLENSHLFFLPPNCQHNFYAQNTNEFLVLDIPSFILANSEIQKISGGLVAVLDERWQAIRFLMLSEVNYQSKNYQNLTHLFHYAYSLLLQETTPRSVQYIQANYQKQLDLQKLAELEGYNLTYYCEWFKKLTGSTPKVYIQTLRLNKAKELLAQTDLSILQVAQRVGYEYHSSLTRVFQQYENITPLAYRQQARRLEKGNPKFS
jgi:AraC-like DNA-binding protein